MDLKIATLEALGAWEVLEYDSETMPNVIQFTWAFKCKRFPVCLIKKFKDWFCARGNMQLEGVDLFETYDPVVQRTTIWLMFILEVLLGLQSKQGDVTCAICKPILHLMRLSMLTCLSGSILKVRMGSNKF